MSEMLEKFDEVLRTVAKQPMPDTIYVAAVPYSMLYAENYARDLIGRGVNWRRVKRERRKAYERMLASLRTNPARQPNINTPTLEWWKARPASEATGA